MPELDESAACTRLITGFLRCRWARPALSALAGTPGQCRQADLVVELVATTGDVVHHRALSHAMSYLAEHRLIRRYDDQPGQVTYEITRVGREFHARFESLEQFVREHHL